MHLQLLITGAFVWTSLIVRAPCALAAPPSPDARARAVLKAQLAALGDDTVLNATFAPNATVLSPGGSFEIEPTSQTSSRIAFVKPHARVTRATFDHVVTGSRGPLVWFAADLHVTLEARDPDQPVSTVSYNLRALELIDGAAEGKVVVAAFSHLAPAPYYGASPIAHTNEAGPIARLLASQSDLAAALSKDAVVLRLGSRRARRRSRTSQGLARALEEAHARSRRQKRA